MTTVAILSLHLPRVSWQRIAPALLVLPLVLYMLAFYLVPLASMLLRSVAEPSWTLDNYRRLAADSVFLEVFWTTLLLS
jgi:ABC-type spermidine/putrescine transport system permease subunit I